MISSYDHRCVSVHQGGPYTTLREAIDAGKTDPHSSVIGRFIVYFSPWVGRYFYSSIKGLEHQKIAFALTDKQWTATYEL